MRIVRTLSGPFNERQLFTQQEIEFICESELEKIGCLPIDPEPVRIERFVEKKFGITVGYETLPAGVLGYTRFGSSGVDAIVVSRDLGEAPDVVSRRRVNTTLAHEAGHGLLHAYLYCLVGKTDVFSVEHTSEAGQPKILCQDGGKSWWEAQANLAMSSLLLPEFLIKKTIAGFDMANPAARASAIQKVSDTFDVNPVVARLRLQKLEEGG